MARFRLIYCTRTSCSLNNCMTTPMSSHIALKLRLIYAGFHAAFSRDDATDAYRNEDDLTEKKSLYKDKKRV